jgi:Carboxypeptidase regulatory-like domain
MATVLTSFVTGSQDILTKTPYKRTGHEATLTGFVTFSGQPPKRFLIDMSVDPICLQYERKPRTDEVVVSNGKLLNVLIYVTSESFDKYSFEPPRSPAVLAHINCRYQPHVLGVQLGQPLRIVNVDKTHHNTHPSPKLNPEWNQMMEAGAPPLTKTLRIPEMGIPFRDLLNPWKKAFVSVFTHPFFTANDSAGNFRIEGLPPGTYRVTAWHEKLGEKTIEVVLEAGKERNLEFNYSVSDLR